jgi:hypothetical protein
MPLMALFNWRGVHSESSLLEPSIVSSARVREPRFADDREARLLAILTEAEQAIDQRPCVRDSPSCIRLHSPAYPKFIRGRDSYCPGCGFRDL